MQTDDWILTAQIIAHGFERENNHRAGAPIATRAEAAKVLLDTHTKTQTVTAACIGHYGQLAKGVGIHGVDLTVNGNNWTFNQGFRRMWRAALRSIAEREG